MICALSVLLSQPWIAPQAALDSQSDILHPAHMSRGADAPLGHFLRPWRKASGLTLEQAAERVERASEARAAASPVARPISMTHATLSRIERGRLPYNQVLLELLAQVYRTDPASLLMRDPSDPEGLWSIWGQLAPVERLQAVEVLKALHRSRQAA
jgi:transcriptional regulator with XRE-family HTH domain